jgi:hypothetical protein
MSSLQPSVSVKDYRVYYRTQQKIFTDACKGKNFSVDVSPYLKGEPSRSVMEALSDNNSRLHGETILTCIDIAERILAGENIGLLGLVQSGKTPSLFFGGLLSCVLIYLKTGIFAQPMYLTPNTENCWNQFRQKSRGIFACIRNMRVTYDGKSIGIEEYMDSLQNKRRHCIGDMLINRNSILGKKIAARVRQQIDAHLSASLHLILPMSQKYGSLIEIIVKTFKEEDLYLVMLRDESHYAIAEKSVNDRIFTDNELYELVNNNQRFQIVMCSATNWVALHLETVLLRVSDQYTGLDFAFFDTKNANKATEEVYTSVAQGIGIKKPEICSISAYAQLTKNPDLAHVVPAWYKDEADFNKKKVKLSLPFADHAKYRQRVEYAVAACITKVFDGVSSDDRSRDHRGMLVRFSNDNAVTDNLIRMIKPKLPDDIKTIRAYDDSFSTIEELLKLNKVNESGRYIVFVTARGRMSDSFPRECGYGIDFTYNSETLAAIIQGVMGRMLGYNKDPFILLSDKNYESIHTRYIDNDFLPRGKALNSVSNFTQKPNLTLRRSDLNNNPVMTEWFAEMQKYVDLCAADHRISVERDFASKKSKTGKVRRPTLLIGERGMNIIKINFWDKYIVPKIDYINENLMHICSRATKYCRVMMPGETDERGESLTITENYGPCLSVRTTGKNFHDHQGGRDKNEGGRKKENGGKKTLIVLRLFAKKRYKKWTFTLDGIDLPNYKLKEQRCDLRNNSPSVPGRISKKNGEE